MRSRKYDSVSPVRVRDEASGILHEQVKLRDHSRKCTLQVLLAVLFFAASRTSSIFDACRRLRRAPCDDTMQDALAEQLPGRVELTRRLNRALSCRLPKSLFRKRRPMAIDLTEIPYHGQPQRDPRELCRGRPKGGTTHFHTYATLYVVRRGERFTIALTPVGGNDSLPEVMQRLLRRASQIGLKPRYLLLDRAFYNLDVVAYLQTARYPFAMPVVYRGRRAKNPEKAQGPQRFLAWEHSGWSTHRLRNQGRTRRVQIAVSYNRRKRGKYRRLVYAYWGFQPSSPAWLRQEYRRRFGIEASYRQMNQARIRTCSRSPALRLFYVGLALILRNVWVWVHRQLARRCGRDGLTLFLECLRFRTLLLILQRFAESLLGTAEAHEAQPAAPG